MTMDRAYVNPDDGFVCCCWNAPSKEALEGLFNAARTPFQTMLPVTEFGSEAYQ